MPVRYEEPVEGWSPPEPQSKRSRLLVAGLIAVIIALVGGLIIALTGNGKEDDPTPPAAVGLERGGATALTGGTGQVGDMRVGFPRTVDGAATAAMSYVPAIDRTLIKGDDLYEVAKYVNPAAKKPTPEQEKALVAGLKEQSGLDASGTVVGADGTPDPDRTYVRELLPVYGAYRIVEVEGDAESPTAVTVEIWAPYVKGTTPIRSSDDMSVIWKTNRSRYVWLDGDWRSPGDTSSVYERAKVQPLDQGDVVSSFEEKARLLPASEGWKLPADGTETTEALPWAG